MIELNNQNIRQFQISASYESGMLDVSDFKPTWDGKCWKYLGRSYRSLRVLKTSSRFKVEREISKTFVCEIQKEIDADILKKLTQTI